MIRFEPDTLRDALWRPIAMIAPDSDVYLEIMAPDFRFAVLVLLTVACAVLARRARAPRAAWLLLALVWLSFVPWLATSGNGRYFLPILLAVGPLCIGLIAALPLRGRMRVTFALVLVAAQATAVALSDPRGSWGLAPWGSDRYFDLALTEQDRQVPAAYVTMSSISYTLVAPLFHPASRWIGIGALSTDPKDRDEKRVQQALAAAQASGLRLELFVPTLPRMGPGLQPAADLRVEIDRSLGLHRLALAPGACRLLPSRTMAQRALPPHAAIPPGMEQKTGFWICPLRYPVARTPDAPAHRLPRDVEQVFGRLEQACPRLFPPGGGRDSPMRGEGAYLRTYSDADTKAYVLEDGEVYFKYWRALNANRVGRVADVLAPGFKLDCNEVHGRSGLPWERVL